MPTRTYLTTPPGREPVLDRSPDGVVERWVPALDLPVEPTPPRHGRTAATIALVAALAVVGLYLAVETVTGVRAEDPSVTDSTGQRQE